MKVFPPLSSQLTVLIQFHEMEVGGFSTWDLWVILEPIIGLVQADTGKNVPPYKKDTVDTRNTSLEVFRKNETNGAWCDPR